MGEATVSKAIEVKALRLLNTGKVTRQGLHDYTVQGDSGTYKVLIVNPNDLHGSCTCRRYVEGHAVCSHLAAACGQALLDVDRYEGESLQEFKDKEAKRWETEDPFDGL